MEMNEKSEDAYQKSNISTFNGTIDVTQFFSNNQLRYGIDVMANTTNTQFESMSEELTDYSTDAGLYAIFKGFLGNLLYEPSIRLSYYLRYQNFCLSQDFL